MTATETTQIDKKIYSTARSCGASDAVARIIVGQSRTETTADTAGVWQPYNSNAFKKLNNGFGMKKPSKRKSPYIVELPGGVTAPSGEANGASSNDYAEYRSIEDSVRDLFHWFNYNGIPYNTLTTPQAYATTLKNKGYFGATLNSYIAAITSQVKRVDWATAAKVAGVGLGALLLIGGVFF